MTLFTNGLLIDGTGSEARKADVLVDKEKILDIGNISSSKVDITIDIGGKIICPGFMDIHAHSELEVLRDPSMIHKIFQGITFDLSGNCGVGVFPKRKEDNECFPDILGYCENMDWSDFKSYYPKVKTGMNIGFLQNHACLRNMAISGNPNRVATIQEVNKMCQLLDDSLTNGCFGFSSGLYYAPCLFADKYEIIELLKVVKKHNAIFTVHHRCEGDEIISSIQEVIQYMKETGVQLEISHLKAIGKDNQKKMDIVLDMIHKAKAEGFDIAFDQYPYEYGSTSLFSLLPPSYLGLPKDELLKTLHEATSEGNVRKDLISQMTNPNGWDSIVKLCGFENITAVILESSPNFNGLTITQCADKLKTDCWTALFTLLSRETRCALMADVTQTKTTMDKVISDNLMCFGTDALYAGGSAHPRSGNAAIHLLTENCIKTKNLTFEQAINRMTNRVAQRLRIKDRGVVKVGNYADLVVFDSKTLKDNSSLSDPYKKCTGLDYVMVNGTFALSNGTPTQSTTGKVILRG